MQRRTALKTTLALGGAAVLGRYAPEAARAENRRSAAEDRIPRKGETWNESFEFPDEATTRLTRRLTTRRKYNHKPTYHIHQGFSPDNRYLPLCTYNADGESALLRADVETGELKALDHAPADAAIRFTSGNALGMIPTRPLVAYTHGGTVLLYDIHTLEKRVLHESPGTSFGHPAGTADGQYIIVARNDIPYDRRADTRTDPFSVLGVTFYRIDIDTGEVTEVFRDDTHRSSHVIPNPVDANLVIIDRDAPPHFGGPNCNADIPRNWVLDLRTGAVTPIEPRNGCHFTWHTNWNHSGDHVYYHGPSADPLPRWLVERYGPDYLPPYKGERGRAHFVGVATRDGQTVWEQEFPVVYYGHSSSHATRDVIILDNVVIPDNFTAVYWREVDAQGIPRMEVLGRHNSDYVAGQQSHPHAQMSTDGKWLSYNSGYGGRTDVYVLRT